MSRPDPGRVASIRRHRFAFAFLFCLTLPLFVAPLLRHEVFVIRDHFDYFQPMRAFTAHEMSEGRLPLWNPYNASGEPWLANPQTGVFYPPMWLFLVLPFATAYMLFLLLHLALLGWGAYLLFERTFSSGAALVGASALMFSGPVLSLLDVQNNLATLAWVPFALWCAVAGAWRRGALVLALAFLAGEPFFAAVAALLFAVVALGSAPRAAWKGTARGIALTAVIAFGLAAVQILPFLEMVRGSDRAAGMDRALVLRDSVPLRDWLLLAVPPRIAPEIDQRAGQQFIPVVYAGILVVSLAAVGAMLAWRRSVAGWLLLLLAAVALATGPEVLARLPLTLFRYPARFLPLGAFAVAALAAAGWNRIRPDRRWLDLLIVLVIVADLLPRARPLLYAERHRADIVPYAAGIGTREKILRVGEIDPTRRAAWMSGYLNLYGRRFDVFTAAPLAGERYLGMHRQLQQTPTPEQLASLAVGWVLTPLRLESPMIPAGRAAGLTMYRYPRASSMAVLRTKRGNMPLEWEIDGARARIVVDAPAEGVVVLSQQMAPGWKVTVDGEKARAQVMEGLFRGVRVSAGHHEVVWCYRPWSLVVGATVTILTLLSLQIARFVKHSHIKNFSSVRANAQ